MRGTSVDRILGLFGATAAVVATLALEADGWSTGEVVAACGIWLLALGAIASIFREDIQDFWYGIATDEVRPASVNDVEAIHCLAKSHFGEDVTPAGQIKSLIYRQKKMFWVLTNRREAVTSLDGYVCLFPLSATHMQNLESLNFSISELTPSSLPRSSNTHAVYIGAVVGQHYRARAKLLMFIEQKSKELAKRSASRTVYAKAATRAGLRTLHSKGFVPVKKSANGIDCFYKIVVS